MESAVKSTPETDQLPAAPVSPLNKAIGIVLLLAVLLFLSSCFVSSLILSFSDVIPVSQYDLDNSSWLGVSPLGFAHIIKLFCAIAAGFTFIHIVITQRVLIAMFSAVIAACLFVSSLQGNLLRLGAWDGDARIGCYTYQSLECRKMLSAPTEGFPSIYSDDKTAVGNGRYAPWYQEVLATQKPQIHSIIPSSIPGVVFFKAPWILAHASEINATLDAQRAELKKIRSSSTLP